MEDYVQQRSGIGGGAGILGVYFCHVSSLHDSDTVLPSASQINNRANQPTATFTDAAAAEPSWPKPHNTEP
jgi:hypothetical protein